MDVRGRLLSGLAVRVAVVLAVVSLGAASVGVGAAQTAHRSTGRVGVPTAGSGNWLVYHGNVDGSGDGGSAIDLSSPTQAWVSPTLDGQLYGEPLVFGTRIYVATENDYVYALSSSTGAVVWHRHLAKPVPASSLPCGNIKPSVGITSTPVIDAARHEIFVVADEEVGGTPQHDLVGLSTTSGAVELTQDVDPPGAYTPALLNRASLTLDDGDVIFGYGGNSGDCSTYHGWVVSVPETGGTMQTFEVDAGSGETQGAVWMGGAAPVVDKSGNVWAAAGNGSVTSSSGPYDDSESVLELTPEMQLQQYFAPSDWYTLNALDEDIGSVAPAVLPDGDVLQGGKNETVYLLSGAALGGVGGQLYEQSGLCGTTIDGGPAWVGDVVYLPCEDGVMAVQVVAGSKTFKVLWQTATGAGGPPVVAGGSVWTISGGTLYGLDPATGAAVHQLSITANATHFPTPAVGDNLLLAPADDQVVAFSG